MVPVGLQHRDRVGARTRYDRITEVLSRLAGVIGHENRATTLRQSGSAQAEPLRRRRSTPSDVHSVRRGNAASTLTIPNGSLCWPATRFPLYGKGHPPCRRSSI